MQFDMSVKLCPSPEFLGILAEMIGLYNGWIDGVPDWSAQEEDLIYNLPKLPIFGPELYDHKFCRRVFDDLLQVTTALFRSDYGYIRNYLSDVHFLFVVGYPRTGGSYLTRELIKATGIDHRSVSEALAHDGFPHIGDAWFYSDSKGFYLQDTLLRIAEFVVIAKFYFKNRTKPAKNGSWVIPKKMHKMINFGKSMKFMFDQGKVDYLITCRHPTATAISVYEKCGGLPADNLFPAQRPRTAIECWIVEDLKSLGFKLDHIAKMDYWSAVKISWVFFYSKLATCGLFTEPTDNMRVLKYGKDEYERCVHTFAGTFCKDFIPGPFHINDKAVRHREWQREGNKICAAMTSLWENLGLPWPELDCV